jgi:DNA adenine methylase
VHERLRRVVILNRKATDVIKDQDGKNTLFYLDPPYVHDTRVTTTEYGEHEMSSDEHLDLLETVSKCEGKFMISMYRHKIYDAFAVRHHWHRVDFDLPNNSAGGVAKRRMTECVWMNFVPDF